MSWEAAGVQRIEGKALRVEFAALHSSVPGGVDGSVPK